jgi:O-antigen ligase
VVHGVLAVGVAGAMALTWPGPTSAAGPPLGYANANATLTALGVLAALQMAAADRTTAGRRAWLGLAVGLGATTVAIGSVAGVLCLVGALAVVGLAAVTRSAHVATIGGIVVVVLVLGVTVAIARGADPVGLGERSEVRGELWAAAADLAAEEPARGVGPGRFEALNPVSDDADLRWAHHGYLQTAAETGAVGLGLLLTLLGWAYIRLAITAALRPGVAVIGAAGLTVVGLHATVDYVLHLPAVPLALAALIGASTSARRPRPAPQPDPGSRG